MVNMTRLCYVVLLMCMCVLLQHLTADGLEITLGNGSYCCCEAARLQPLKPAALTQ